MTTKTLQASDLAQFFGGTSQYYKVRHFPGIFYTDGARHVFQAGEAYWLLDLIGSNIKLNRDLYGEEFQVWTLKVKDSVGMLTCDDGNRHVLLAEKIEYTDFPLDEITLWVEAGYVEGHNDMVIMLPEER